MTADEMVEQALGRLGEFTSTFPSVRGPMYRRIGHRQRELFALAAKINPERFGSCATAALQTVSGIRVVDLSDIVAPTPTPEMIQRVEVDDDGTSPYPTGTQINVVTVADLDAELPPRAVLRDRLLIGVSTELDLVASVRIYYSRLPDLFTLSDAAKTLELEAPYDTLLEVDLVKWLLAKATAIESKVRADAIASMAAEEAPLLAAFEAHVADYGPTVSRFSAPRNARAQKA